MTAEARNRRILVVDDDQDIIEFLQTLLGIRGLEVIGALTGSQGLALAEAEEFGVILLDIRMAEIDGHEVCRRLKSNPRTADVPVLVLTAVDCVEDIARCINEGADGFMAKPFDNRSLVESIARMLDPGSSPPVFPIPENQHETMLRRIDEFKKGHWIICLRLLESGSVSALQDEGILQGAHVLSLAQQKREGERRTLTAALLEVETLQAFADIMDGIYSRGGKVVFCRTFRHIKDVPLLGFAQK